MLNQLISVYKFLGINNVEKSLRLSYSRGSTFLADGLNLDIDNSGMIAKRRGVTKKVDGNFSSLWSDKSFIYGVKDGYIFRFDGSTLDSLFPITRTSVDFCRGADRVFFTGDTFMGFIDSTGANFPESKKTTVYTRDVLELQGKKFQITGIDQVNYVEKYGLLTGTFCTTYLARLYVAEYTQLTYSLPFDYLYTLPTAYMLMPGRITALKGTPSFLFVGTEKGAFVISGEGKEATMKQISSKEVLYNSACVVESALVDPSLTSPFIVLFSQPSGVYATQGATATKLTPHYRIGTAPCKGASIKVTNNGDSFPIYQYCLNMEA